MAHNLGGDKATLIHAYNVLRQYNESEVSDARYTMAKALAPNGLFIEGTSNPSGRFVVFDIYQINKVGILLHKLLVFGWNFRGLCDVNDFKAILPKRLIRHAYDPGPAAFFATWERALQIAQVITILIFSGRRQLCIWQARVTR